MRKRAQCRSQYFKVQYDELQVWLLGTLRVPDLCLQKIVPDCMAKRQARSEYFMPPSRSKAVGLEGHLGQTEREVHARQVDDAGVEARTKEAVARIVMTTMLALHPSSTTCVSLSSPRAPARSSPSTLPSVRCDGHAPVHDT